MKKYLEMKEINWQQPALFSLCLAIVGSILSLTKGLIPTPLIFFTLLLALVFGIVSIARQVKSSKARILYFDHSNWTRTPEGGYELEVRSDFIIFRVEQPDESGRYHKVIGGTTTSKDGISTFIYFSGNMPVERLAGRIIVK